MGRNVPAGVGRDGVVGVGDEGDLVGDDLQDEVDELRDGIAFDVELRGDVRPDEADVGVAYVPLVGAGMHGDALRAEALAVPGGLLDVGKVAPAGVAQRGELVYVDTQSGHISVLLKKAGPDRRGNKITQ